MKRNVPKLRFNGFDDEWEENKIENIFDKVKNPVKVEEDRLYKQIGIRSHGKGIFYKEFVTGKELGNKRVFWIEPNVFIVNIVFAWERAVAKTTDNEIGMIASHRFPMYKPKGNLLNLDYITYLFKTKKGQNLLELASPGGAGRNKTLGQKEFDKLVIKLPSLQEQEKIANFLTKVDSLIEEQDGKVQDLGLYKKGMMQKIFSQKIRFKDDNGCEYPEWEKKHLEEFVERVVRKNKGNASNKPLTISAQYGLVNQEEFFNKVVASKNLEGYYLLNKGEFAYNKSYSNGYPFGAIKRLDRYENGAVSTLYVCFKPKHDVNSNYLVQYFESNKWHNEVSMIAVEGARNHGLLNVSVSDFFATIHKFPCLEEQTKIANFLSNIDLIIEEEKNKLEDLRQWKKGLLQQMFV